MGVRSAARTLRAKTINKHARVQCELCTRNRMRLPLSRTSRRTRIPRIRLARPLSKPSVILNRAQSRATSVARVATSPPRATRTRAPRASATLVVACGHMARDCATRAAQAKAQTSSSTSNAVASAGNGAAQIFALALIAGLRITDALIDTCSAFSLLSSAMYVRLRDAPVI